MAGRRAFEFEDERYINLTTFKRDGSGVETPVWFVEIDGKLCLFTDGTSYKVKRLRRDPRIKIAACNAFGKVRGEWVEGDGRIVENHALIQQINQLLAAKYGWQLRLVNLISAIAGRIGRRAYLELTV